MRKSYQKRPATYAVRRTATKRSRIQRPVPRNTTVAPFPLRQIRTLTYCDSAVITIATAETVKNYELRANSIFAPDAGGGGAAHQPYGHDTFETLYNFYSVKSATIDVWYGESNSENTTPTPPTMCGVWVNDNGTEITDETLIREQPGSISKLLVNDNTVQVRAIYKRDDRYPAYDQNDVGSVFGASPSELVVFNIFAAKDGAFTTTSSVTAYYKISYEVEMWDPKKLASS